MNECVEKHMKVSDEIRRKIGEARKNRGWSQATLAQNAGTIQQTVDRIELGKTKMSAAVPGILRALELDGELAAIPIARGVKVRIPSNEIRSGQRDFPIHSAAEGGAGALVVSHDPIEYIDRPGPLIGVSDAYGLYVIGESMVPRYSPGDVLLIHPHLPPRAGSHVVLLKQDGGSDYMMVKKLTKITQGHWHLSQYNPPAGEAEGFTLSRAEWPVCQVIVGSYERG